MITSVAVLGAGMRWARARFHARPRGSCAHAFWSKAGAHAVESCAPFSNGARFPDGSLTVPCTVPVTVPCYDLWQSKTSMRYTKIMLTVTMFS